MLSISETVQDRDILTMVYYRLWDYNTCPTHGYHFEWLWV